MQCRVCQSIYRWRQLGQTCSIWAGDDPFPLCYVNPITLFTPVRSHWLKSKPSYLTSNQHTGGCEESVWFDTEWSISYFSWKLLAKLRIFLISIQIKPCCQLLLFSMWFIFSFKVATYILITFLLIWKIRITMFNLPLYTTTVNLTWMNQKVINM